MRILKQAPSLTHKDLFMYAQQFRAFLPDALDTDETPFEVDARFTIGGDGVVSVIIHDKRKDPVFPIGEIVMTAMMTMPADLFAAFSCEDTYHFGNGDKFSVEFYAR